MNAERSIGAQQNQQAQWAIGQGQGAIDKMNQYQNPLIQYLKGQMTNQSNRVAANAVPIGQIAQGVSQAKENILDSQPAGAGRDFALAGLKRDQSAQTSGLLNSAFLAAPGAMAQLGTQQGQLGTALTGQGGGLLGGAATTYGNVAQQQAQANQGWMNALMGVAGIAGNVATGFLKRPSQPGGTVGDVDFGGAQPTSSVLGMIGAPAMPSFMIPPR